jgi:HAMP domain-containing protein
MSADDGSQITAMAASRPKVQPGLRLQIVLSLAGLMVLAFVPLFFAVASLTQAAMHPAGREIPGRVERGDSAGERRPGPAGPTAGADRGASLVRLVALYMVVFALALVVFAYFSLTRLIVRPIDELVAAADRVASGARTMRVPRSGASSGRRRRSS